MSSLFGLGLLTILSRDLAFLVDFCQQIWGPEDSVTPFLFDVHQPFKNGDTTEIPVEHDACL